MRCCVEVYAQNTFNEVLGWYGLCASSAVVSTASLGADTATAHGAQPMLSSSCLAAASLTTHRDDAHLQLITADDRPLDLTCNHVAATANAASSFFVSLPSSRLYIFTFLSVNQSHTHTHTINGPFSGNTRVSRYQKGQTNLDFTEARDSEWQWRQLGHVQVCTSLQTDNHTSTPPLTFFTGRMPFLPPNQQRQSTEGKQSVNQSVNFQGGLSGATTARTTSWMMSADDVRI